MSSLALNVGLEAGLGSGPAGLLLVVAACGLDRLVGDPCGLLHPVQVMGWCIARLRGAAEAIAGESPLALRLAGGAITLALVGGSGLAGWSLERICLPGGPLPAALGLPLLVVALASALAGRSLEQAVQQVLAALPEAPDGDLEPARRQLAWIVGRDTEDLSAADVLRALAETASENAVDGLFAPLFWMLAGALLWGWSGLGGAAGSDGTGPAAGWPPGPLALAWGFKAASTLDSMLGYRRGRLRWLGTAGARLDDLLTWLPCRLVALSLPLAAGRLREALRLFRRALVEGAPDPSPNAGVSQAIYALVVGCRLGGLNHYGGEPRPKPILASGAPPPDRAAVERMLGLSYRLELLWLLTGGLAAGLAAVALQAQ